MILALAVSLGFNSIPDSSHYCESREVKAYCFELSDGIGTRCYTLPAKAKYVVCSEGWEKIPDVIKSDTPKPPCAEVVVIAKTDIGDFYCDGITEDAKCGDLNQMYGFG